MTGGSWVGHTVALADGQPQHSPDTDSPVVDPTASAVARVVDLVVRQARLPREDGAPTIIVEALTAAGYLTHGVESPQGAIQLPAGALAEDESVAAALGRAPAADVVGSFSVVPSGARSWHLDRSPHAVFSLGGGQHLPSDAAADELVALLASGEETELVVFSSATPGEGAALSVRPYPLERRARFWVQLFEARGFEFSATLTVLARDHMFEHLNDYAEAAELPKNLLVFVRPLTRPVRSALRRLESSVELLQAQWFSFEVHTLLVEDSFEYRALLEDHIPPSKDMSRVPTARGVMHGGSSEARKEAQDRRRRAVDAAPRAGRSDGHGGAVAGATATRAPATRRVGASATETVASSAGGAPAVQRTASAAKTAPALRLPPRRPPPRQQPSPSPPTGAGGGVGREQGHAKARGRRAAVLIDDVGTAQPVLSATPHAQYQMSFNYTVDQLLVGTDYSKLLQKYLVASYKRDADAMHQLHVMLLQHLHYFQQHQTSDETALCRFLSVLLFILGRDDANIVATALAVRYLSFAPMIAQMAHATDVRTTDVQLRMLSNNPDAFVQTLAMYSPYNSLTISVGQLWPRYQLLANFWFKQIHTLVFDGALANPHFYARMRALVRDMVALPLSATVNFISSVDRSLPASQPEAPWWQLYELFFSISYIDEDLEPLVKSQINSFFQLSLPELDSYTTTARLDRPLLAADGRQRILVVCAQWKHGHSVHRNFDAYVHALQQEFEVTLLFLESDQITREQADRRGFAHVKVSPKEQPDRDVLELVQWVRRQRFHAIFFPQVGMHFADVLLANTRLARLQVTSYGHSSSTNGAIIDYFVGGDEVEGPNPQQYYSERLVTVPGMGIVFNPFTPDTSMPAAVEAPAPGTIVINCAWTMVKVNYDHLLRIAQVIREVQGIAPIPLELRFFSAISPSSAYAIMAITNDIEAALDLQHYSNVKLRVLASMSYDSYIATIKQGHVGLDSFPYGGCNSVFDLLHSGVVPVVMEGVLWRNRIAPAMLRRIHLEELVASTTAEYVSIAVSLITHDEYRAVARKKVLAADLDGQFSNTGEARAYPPLFAKLIAEAQLKEW